jgi:hypothetical protein
VTLQLITTIVVALVALALAVIRILKDSATKASTKDKLEKTEKIVVAIGSAINAVTPMLGLDEAKRLKSTIKGTAQTGGVLGDLDGLIKRHGLNDRTTAELANPHG